VAIHEHAVTMHQLDFKVKNQRNLISAGSRPSPTGRRPETMADLQIFNGVGAEDNALAPSSFIANAH